MKNDVTFIIERAEVKPEIQMPVHANIYELKLKIEERIGIQVSRQTLWSGTLELNDFAIIDHYDFRGTVSIRLQVQPLPGNAKVVISVLSTELGFELEYAVRETDTVLELKKMIEESWKSYKQMGGGLDVVPEDMALWHLDVEMKDDLLLSKYYIHEGCKINMGTTVIC